MHTEAFLGGGLKRHSRKEIMMPELIVIFVRQELLGTGYANTHFAKFVSPIWVYSSIFRVKLFKNKNIFMLSISAPGRNL